MKKQNNRFRSGNSNIYTLNYKFDSVSIAGKISGTALDLIRRYNDLAKEAQSSGDYVDMEIYRQYAEHYRKIVTEINERRQSRIEQNRAEDTTGTEENHNEDENVSEPENSDNTAEVANETMAQQTAPNGYVETLPATEPAKSFHVVEIKENEADNTKEETTVKPKRVYHRRTSAKKVAAEA